MNRLLHTNVEIYRMIADEAYQKMVQSLEDSRRPKPDGSAGWIITYNPEHTSFKQAMISIAFTGIWLEAMLHLLIVKAFGEHKFKEYDFKSYEEKLKLLDFTDQQLIASVSRFREARRELVHEKAYLDEGKIRFAQKEAENAHTILTEISKRLSEKSSQHIVSVDAEGTRHN